MSDHTESRVFTGEEEPRPGTPSAYVVPRGARLCAAVIAPHLLYPEAFQASPESFVVAVIEDEDGSRTSMLGLKDVEPTESET